MTPGRRSATYMQFALQEDAEIQEDTSKSPGVMAWSAIRFTSQLHLINIDGTLKSGRYICVALRPVALPFNQALQNATFQQDNARPHVVNIIQTLFNTEKSWFMPWSTLRQISGQ